MKILWKFVELYFNANIIMFLYCFCINIVVKCPQPNYINLNNLKSQFICCCFLLSHNCLFFCHHQFFSLIFCCEHILIYGCEWIIINVFYVVFFKAFIISLKNSFHYVLLLVHFPWLVCGIKWNFIVKSYYGYCTPLLS